MNAMEEIFEIRSCMSLSVLATPFH